MKIVIVGDLIVSSDIMKEAVEQLKTNEENEIVCIHWYAKDRKEFQKKALNLELHGPKAEVVPEEVYTQIKNADILLVHFCPVPSEVIEAAEKLKLIGTCRGGMEHIDVACATRKNIPVIHCIRNAEATSDFAIGLMYAETRNIARSFAALKQGEWRKEYINSSYTTTFSEMTLGIIGLGHIGKLVAKKAIGLGMRVIAHDPYISEETLKEKGLDVTLLDKEEVFKTADIISLHLRATPETENSIDKVLLGCMKPTAYLINTSRAKVIVKEDLVHALQTRSIGGAALDVYWQEPLEKNDPLLKLDNITLTPHNAGNVVDALPKSPKLLVTTINDFWSTGTSDMVVNIRELVK